MHAANSFGLLAAIQASAAAAIAGGGTTAAHPGAAELHTAGEFFKAAGLQPAERTQLREFLLQVRFDILSCIECTV